MRYRIFLIFLLVIMPFCWGQNIKIKQIPVIAKVDPRIELMSIVGRLAGLGGYESQDFKLYVDKVNNQFLKDTLHPAVLYLKDLKKEKGLGYDAVMRMAVYLDYPSLKPKVAFTSTIPAPSWGKVEAEEFLPLIRDFVQKSDFHNFYIGNQKFYQESEKRFQKVLNQVNFDWFEKFYGYAPEDNYNLYLGLLNGRLNYGFKVTYPKNEEFIAIMNTFEVDEEGLPIWKSEILPTVIHEFNHSFIDHLISQDTTSWKMFEPIHGQVQYQMSRLLYPKWQTSLSESLVRAAVIRYEMENEIQDRKVLVSVQNEVKNGFYWIEDLVALMGVYRSNKKPFPSFDAYLPIIKTYYEDLSANMGFKFLNYQDKIPNIITAVPFENGAVNVDPSIEEITLIFNQPMNGWSFGYSDLGKEHYPLTSIVGWDKSDTQLKINVKLEPNKNYEILVRNEGFRSKEGYPPVPFVFSFRTK